MQLRIIAALFLSTISTAVLAKQQLISVPVRFETLLSSEMFTIKHQDKFETPKAVVAEDILDIDGNISIKEGTEVVVYVNTKRRKNMARRGKITFTLKEVEDVNGNIVPLDATFDVIGRKKAGLVGQVFSGKLTKNKSQFSIGGVGATTVIGAVAVGTAASIGISSALVAKASKIGIDTVSDATYDIVSTMHEQFLSDLPDGGNRINLHAYYGRIDKPQLRTDMISGTKGFTKFALQHEIELKKTLQLAKVVTIIAVGVVATAVAAGAITTIVLASTKGKEAVIEPGTIWQIVTTAPSL